MKVRLGYGLEDDFKVMTEIKRALGSREVTLMVDTNHGYGLSDALRLGKELEQYNCEDLLPIRQRCRCIDRL